MICAFACACVLYNALYLSYCVKEKRVKSAFGSAAVIGLIAAGVLLLGFNTSW